MGLGILTCGFRSKPDNAGVRTAQDRSSRARRMSGGGRMLAGGPEAFWDDYMVLLDLGEQKVDTPHPRKVGGKSVFDLRRSTAKVSYRQIYRPWRRNLSPTF